MWLVDGLRGSEKIPIHDAAVHRVLVPYRIGSVGLPDLGLCVEIKWAGSSRLIEIKIPYVLVNELRTPFFITQTRARPLAPGDPAAGEVLKLPSDGQPIPLPAYSRSCPLFIRMAETEWSKELQLDDIDGLHHMQLLSTKLAGINYDFGLRVTHDPDNTVVRLQPIYCMHSRFPRPLDVFQKGCATKLLTVQPLADAFLIHGFRRDKHDTMHRLCFTDSGEASRSGIVPINKPGRYFAQFNSIGDESFLPTGDTTARRDARVADVIRVDVKLDSNGVTHIVLTRDEHAPFKIENRSAYYILYTQISEHSTEPCAVCSLPPGCSTEYSWQDWGLPPRFKMCVPKLPGRRSFGEWIEVQILHGSHHTAVDVVSMPASKELSQSAHVLVYAITNVDPVDCRRRVLITEKECGLCPRLDLLPTMFDQQSRQRTTKSFTTSSVVVFENQSRLNALQKFSANTLSPVDPAAWTDPTGCNCPREHVALPSDEWAWMTDWTLRSGPNYDADGWEYAFNWRSTFTAGKSAVMFVRRRCWVRTMEHKGAIGSEAIRDLVQDGPEPWEMIGDHNGDPKGGCGGGSVAFAVKGKVKSCSLSLWDGASQILRLSLDDLCASISQADVGEVGSQTWVYQASVQDLQLDNYYEQAMYLVVVAKEWSSLDELQSSPAIRVSAVQRIGSAATIVFFESITVEISKMVVQLDLTTMNRMAEWYRQWAEKDSYMDEDLNPLDTGYLKDVDEYTVYIEKMRVSEVKGVFNFTVGQGDDVSEIRPDLTYAQKSLGWVAGNIQGYQYKSDELVISHESLTKAEIKHRLITHYTKAIWSPKERLKIFGSAAALGNPSGFFGSIESGLNAFEQETKSGGGVGRGLESLAAHTAKGALGSLASVTGTMSKGLSSITLDDEYISRQQDGHKQRPANLKSGINSGMIKFRQGLVDAVTGFVAKPIEGAQHDGLRGFAEGGVQGFLGLVCKPVVGALNAVTDSANGMNQTITRRASIGHVLERRPNSDSWGTGADSCGIAPALLAGSVQSNVQRQAGNFLERQGGSIFLMDKVADVMF